MQNAISALGIGIFVVLAWILSGRDFHVAAGTSRRGDIARLGLKAMVGGALASYMLASVAGAFYSGTSMLGIK
jgi:nucleoside permease NupC